MDVCELRVHVSHLVHIRIGEIQLKRLSFPVLSYIHIYMCVCVCVCKYIYIYIYIYIGVLISP